MDVKVLDISVYRAKDSIWILRYYNGKYTILMAA